MTRAIYLLKKIKRHTVSFFEDTYNLVFSRPFSQIEDVCSDNLRLGYSIPPVVHQTFSKNIFGSKHIQSLNRFRDLNSDLDFRFYDSLDRDNWMKKNFSEHPILTIYNNVNFEPCRVDIFRYCLIFIEGGYYFDISKMILVPLSQLHSPDANGVLSFESNSCLVSPLPESFIRVKCPYNYCIQWGFGFAPNSPILLRCIEQICYDYAHFKDKFFLDPKMEILRFTGPGQFTKAVWASADTPYFSEVQQFGIDFDGLADFSIPGSSSRYLFSKRYGNASNSRIVS